MVIVSGLVGAILSALIAIYVSLLGRNSSLDSSSKWREDCSMLLQSIS